MTDGAIPGSGSPTGRSGDPGIKPIRVGQTRSGPRPTRLFPATLLFVCAVFVVVNGALWWLYQRFLSELDQQLGRRLVAVAVTAAGALDGRWAGSAGPGSADAIFLRRVLDENQLANITVIAPDETTLLDLRHDTPEGERNPTLDLYLVPVTRALAGEPDVSVRYPVGGVFLKSGFAPIRDGAGEVVAALSVEAGASLFDALRDIRRSLWLTAALSVTAVLVLGGGFISTATRQARLESSLQRADNLATMGQLTAMLAHEIRNPLGIIKGSAERLRDRYGLADDELYRFIPEEVDRLNLILGNYLQFAREESDAAGTFTPAELLTSVARLLEPELARDGVTLRVILDAAARNPVRGDGARLRQALLNLVLNAAQSMTGGGTIEVNSRVETGRLRLSVRDAGPGLAPDVLRKLGEPFFTTRERGSGLGLAIVLRIAEAHGGMLLAENPVGGGARFTLDLPARPAARAPEETETA